jgi:hypothetical protein
MNQHRNSISVGEAMTTALGRDHIEVVVVVAGDGEVPHPAVVLLRDSAADHAHSAAVRGFEVLVIRKLFGGIHRCRSGTAFGEIRDNLRARITEAEREGWTGEAEGLKVSLAAATSKLAQADLAAVRRAEAVHLGIPAYRYIAAATITTPANIGDR